MTVIFEQTFILFIFGVIGFVLSKKRMVNSEQTQIISRLLVYVFLPCKIYKTFSNNFNKAYLLGHYPLVVTSLLLILILAAGTHFLLKPLEKNSYRRSVFQYSLIIPNYGYIGYSLAEALLGQSGLMNAMMYAVPMTFYAYTVGYAMLTKKPLSLKNLKNPIVFSLVAGMATGWLEIPIPDLLMTILNQSGACAAPLSMLLAGIVVSEYVWKELRNDKMVYLIVAVRLVALPILAGIVTNFFGMKVVTEITVLMCAMPCGMNTVVFPKMIGEDCKAGAALALWSSILACITIPVVCTLFHIGI